MLSSTGALSRAFAASRGRTAAAPRRVILCDGAGSQPSVCPMTCGAAGPVTTTGDHGQCRRRLSSRRAAFMRHVNDDTAQTRHPALLLADFFEPPTPGSLLEPELPPTPPWDPQKTNYIIQTANHPGEYKIQNLSAITVLSVYCSRPRVSPSGAAISLIFGRAFSVELGSPAIWRRRRGHWRSTGTARLLPPPGRSGLACCFEGTRVRVRTLRATAGSFGGG